MGLDLPAERFGDIIVSVHPHVPIDPSKIVHERHFSQPLTVLDSDSIVSRVSNETWIQKNVHPGVSITGAWTGYGYHEDGLVSSFNAVKRMGVVMPELKPRHPPLPAITPVVRMQMRIIKGMEAMRIALMPLIMWDGSWRAVVS